MTAAKIANGTLTNTQISNSAAIAYSKLNLATSIVNGDISNSAAIAYSKLNLSGSIVNADVSNSAAITYGKLNLAGSIKGSDISAVGADAIPYSKLNLATSIVNADVSSSAAIAYSKLNLTNSIVNGDINSSAAIAYSKLNLAGSIVNADVSSSAAIAYSKLNLANSIVGSDIVNGTISSSDLSSTGGSEAVATANIQANAVTKAKLAGQNGSFTITPVANINNARCTDFAATVSGIAANDNIILNGPTGAAGTTAMNGTVLSTAANTINVRICNNSGGNAGNGVAFNFTYVALR